MPHDRHPARRLAGAVVGGDRPRALRAGVPAGLPADGQPARRRGPHAGDVRPRVPLAARLHARHVRGLAAPHHHQPVPRPGRAAAAHPDGRRWATTPSATPSRRPAGRPRARRSSTATSTTTSSARSTQLPPEYRAAVVLCDIEGLSYEEIAVTLGIKLGTVRSRIHRARARLRVLARAPRAAARADRRPGATASPLSGRSDEPPRVADQRAGRRAALGGGHRDGARARRGLPRVRRRARRVPRGPPRAGRRADEVAPGPRPHRAAALARRRRRPVRRRTRSRRRRGSPATSSRPTASASGGLGAAAGARAARCAATSGTGARRCGIAAGSHGGLGAVAAMLFVLGDAARRRAHRAPRRGPRPARPGDAADPPLGPATPRPRPCADGGASLPTETVGVAARRTAGRSPPSCPTAGRVTAVRWSGDDSRVLEVDLARARRHRARRHRAAGPARHDRARRRADRRGRRTARSTCSRTSRGTSSGSRTARSSRSSARSASDVASRHLSASLPGRRLRRRRARRASRAAGTP